MPRVARAIGSMLVVVLINAGCSDDPAAPSASDQTTTTTTSPAGGVETTQLAPVVPTSAPVIDPPSSESPAAAATTAPAEPDIIPIIDEADAVLAIIRSRDDLRMFAALVEAVGADRVFLQERGVTILAPNDDAWSTFDDDAWEALLADPDAAALEVAKYLAVGPMSIASLVSAGTFQNAMSESFAVLDGDPVTIGGAPVVDADLEADNGFVHVLGALPGGATS
jgi:uncharacterized surface protein with fasciclin (FAS1) repeats